MKTVTINEKAYDLPRLVAELRAAGITLPHGLGADSASVHTYTDDGEILAFSEADQAAVDAVMAAHQVAAPLNYGNDAIPLTDVEILRTFVTESRDYLGKSNPTPPENVAQNKRITRAILALLQHLGI